MRTAPCRGCKQEIGFIKTKGGKTMPVNTESMYFFPTEHGPELFVLPDGKVKRGRQMATQIDGAAIGYISHFATCPEADSFRKPRKKDRK